MEKSGIYETQQELQEDTDSDITWTEDAHVNSTEEFITFDQIRKVIGINSGITTQALFEEIKDLGHGGVGAILSVREKILHRDVAIKMLRPAYRKRKRSVGRLIREARATAKIEHPNIVPIHMLGVMDDIGVFFTMKKISGETLQEVLLHLEQEDKAYREKYPPSRLLDIFVSICQGVAFAHSKGIIHRDLKPSNIMLGDFGEVLVMDWGLVKFKGEEEESELFGVYSESHGDKMLTLDGTITGTPLFMSPEQACGWSEEVDEQSDVYSLGVILYAVLTWRQAPFKNSNNIREVLDKVVKGEYLSPRRAAKRKVPRELDAICLKAMAKRKAERYLSVMDLLKDIRNYREDYPVSAYRAPLLRRFTRFCGRNRLVAGAVMVALTTIACFMSVKAVYDNLEYQSDRKAADYNSEFADQARMRAFTLFRQLKRESETPSSGTDLKMLEKDFRRNCSEFENRYNTALLFYSKIEKMYRRDTVVINGISEVYRKLFEFAIATRDFDYADKLVEMATMRSRSLSYLNEDARRAFLQMRSMVSSSGDIKITTSPPGAQVTLCKLNDNNLVYGSRSMGKTPLTCKDLAPGAYLAIFKLKDYHSVRYPFNLGRAEDLDLKVRIPQHIPTGMVYVPGGYVPGEESNGKPVYLDSFFMRRYEVTFGEYLQFWKSLRNPMLRSRYMAKVGLDPSNMIELWDNEGKLQTQFQENMPVVGISAEAAEAYCQWLGQNDKQTYRLPTSQEWDRAARGISGRRFVWGMKPRQDAAYYSGNPAYNGRYHEAAPVGSFAGDVSLFGIFDLAGNVREMVFSRQKGNHILRGGSWATGEEHLAADWSESIRQDTGNDVGFRYVMELPEKPL